MKRMLIAAATSSMLALAAPGLASAAHKRKCHHHALHACAKSRHASRARVLTFGGPSSTTRTTGSGTTPTAPSTPSEPPETAGTVASFTGGVLTITLKDGSTVSGKVTETTEIRCQSATPPPEGGDADQNGDEASGGNGDDGAPHSGPLAGSHGDDMSSGTGDDGGQGQPSTCTTAALVPTAVVSEAELSIGAAGAVWDHVDLIA
jgi:hypothetical protein